MATATWLAQASCPIGLELRAAIRELVRSRVPAEVLGHVDIRLEPMAFVSALREFHRVVPVKNKLADGTYKRGALRYASIEEALQRLEAGPVEPMAA